MRASEGHLGGCLAQRFGALPHDLQGFELANQSRARCIMPRGASSSVPRPADLLFGPGPPAVEHTEHLNPVRERAIHE